MKQKMDYKIKWEKLLCAKRIREISNTIKDSNDKRSAFDSDYSRIVFSSAFRRLQDKAQVFPLEDSDFVRTRLTHSIEVSTIAESIGVSIEKYLIDEKKMEFDKDKKGQLSKILACAGLLHDIGNTPFGHFGESTIQEVFKKLFNNKGNELQKKLKNVQDKEESENIESTIKELNNINDDQKNDFLHFDGNAQAFRTICCLQSIQSYGGLNLTYGTLSALIKYPRSSSEGNKLIEEKKEYVSYKKYGYLQSEKKYFLDIVKETGLLDENQVAIRNPIVYILEAADDIAYSASDIEDGLKKGLLSIEYLKKEILDVFYSKYETSDNEEILKKYNEEDKTFAKIKIEGTIKELNLYDKLDENEKKIMKALYDDIEFGDENDSFKRAQMLRVAIQGYMITSVIDEFKCKYDLIMNGEYEKELLNESKAGALREKLKKITIEKIFNNQETLKNELAGEKVVSKLMELFINAVLIVNKDKNVVTKKAERLYGIISDNYKAIYENETDKSLYYRLQLVVDFISGMTDFYALNLYKQLQGVIM